jgi:hypothetical protein
MRQFFLRTAACLTLTLLETGVQTNANAAGTNGQMCFQKHAEARDNKFFGRPFDDRPCGRFLTSLSHAERTYREVFELLVKCYNLLKVMSYHKMFNLF